MTLLCHSNYTGGMRQLNFEIYWAVTKLINLFSANINKFYVKSSLILRRLRAFAVPSLTANDGESGYGKSLSARLACSRCKPLLLCQAWFCSGPASYSKWQESPWLVFLACNQRISRRTGKGESFLPGITTKIKCDIAAPLANRTYHFGKTLFYWDFLPKTCHCSV